MAINGMQMQVGMSLGQFLKAYSTEAQCEAALARARWPGRASENKVPFVAAVQMFDGRPMQARFDRVENFSFAALRPWAAQALTPGCRIVSDGLLGFEVLERLGHDHALVIAP